MLTSGTYSYHNSTLWDEFSLGVLFTLTYGLQFHGNTA
jgi:hypothetical protein